GVTLPQRAEIRDCLRVLSYPGTACKKRLCTVLSWNPLENNPVYDHDCENQKHSVCESFQQERAKGRFSHREDRSSSFIWCLPLFTFPRKWSILLRRIPRKRGFAAFLHSLLAVVSAVGIG